MSDLYNPTFNRKKLGNFNKNKSFVSVIGGTDAYFMEDEFNEMQWIQNEEKAELLRLKYYSGIIDKDPIDDIVTQPEDRFIPDLFSFHKNIALVNGYIVKLMGNMGMLNENKVIKNEEINNVLLNAPPTDGKREDFVYLEVWFKEIKHDSDIWHNGNEWNYRGLITNDIFDMRINGETCRRLQMQWAIRTVDGIDFKTNPMGFSDELMASDGQVKAMGGYTKASTYGFWRSDLNLDGISNLTDKGLWIAGKGIPGEMETANGYVFAIPLFRIPRINSAGYTTSNPNGGKLFDPTSKYNVPDRPDGKFANIIYREDIKDLRNTIYTEEQTFERILERNFSKLLTGELQKRHNTLALKELFGVNPIIPDSDSKIYVSFNKTLNSITNRTLVPLAVNNLIYNYVPGVEQEAVVFNNSGSLTYNIDSTFEVGCVTMMLKALTNSNRSLWSIKDEFGNSVMALNIKDEQLIIYDMDGVFKTIPLSETPIRTTDFSHIAITWSKPHKKLYVVMNGNIIKIFDMEDRFNSSNKISQFLIGYCQQENFGCADTILDEIEYATRISTSFAQLPGEFVNGTAILCVDIQKGRRLYTNIPDISTITEHVTYVADGFGKISITVNAPIGSLFTTKTPKIYFDNEGISPIITWTGYGTSQLIGDLSNLGPNVTYNFVIIYELEFNGQQGLSYLPEKVYRVIGEKIEKPFMAVRADRNMENYEINQIYFDDQSTVSKKDKLVVYKADLTNQLGFGCAIKFYIKGNGTNQIKIPQVLYGQEISTVYDISVVGSLSKKHLITSYNLSSDNNISVILTSVVEEAEELEIIVGTQLPSVIYNYIAGGIENMFQVNKIKQIGDGIKNAFTFRFDTKVINVLASNIKGTVKFMAYVNGVAQIVNVDLKDTFITIIFDSPPPNKSDIICYVCSEYDPVRSERFEVWYQTSLYPSTVTTDYVASLNGSDVVYHSPSIYVMTEGLNKPIDARLNKHAISSIYLPLVNNIDTKLVPTFVINEATNMKVPVDYVLMNNNDNNDPLPVLNKLKLSISDVKGYRGFTGFVTVDDKTLCSNYQFTKAIPHLNVFPMLVKDGCDKLKMAVITSYSDDRTIKVSAEYNGSAIEIYDLDENILLK
jgi:hypothetical protein